MRPEDRTALLAGVAGASEVHDAFGLEDAHADGRRAIDVFRVIEELQIPLAFAPLDRLLGTFVRVTSTQVGILITSRRDLHMQRFTAAHELGHFVLEHERSFDERVGFPSQVRDGDLRETEADAFAAELVMPSWLIDAIAERRGWLTDHAAPAPRTVYQLSLRLAASYEATCWGLLSHGYIDRRAALELIGNGRRVKEIKTDILGGIALADPWADVWLLSEGDEGAHLEAGPNDVFVVELAEPASSGYRWDPSPAVDAGFVRLADASTFSESVVGGPAVRRLGFTTRTGPQLELSLRLSRSFATETDSRTFGISISTVGTRRGGAVADAPKITLH